MLQEPYDATHQKMKRTTNETQTVPKVLAAARESINQEIASIQFLEKAASQHPYYKYSHQWTREVQSSVASILLCGYLGGMDTARGQLLTLDDVARVLGVPANLKDRDAFHLTIEEYLQALISLLDELARLARNSVTLGDYRRPMEIAKFIKDVHAGFQILNLKNDSLRKRSDGVKYTVKEVEDVVYDLSLRGLVPKE